jgi:hypothetical protein
MRLYILTEEWNLRQNFGQNGLEEEILIQPTEEGITLYTRILDIPAYKMIPLHNLPFSERYLCIMC